MIEQSLEERVKQLRICLALHSYIYYELAGNVVDDKQWDLWASELKVLQRRYGERTSQPEYDKWFKDWDGTTGYELCSIPGLRESAQKTYPHLFKE